MGDGFEKVFRVNKDNALVQKVANDVSKPKGNHFKHAYKFLSYIR